jgi:hypothetical protein
MKTNWTEEKELRTIWEFLGRYGLEVEGRAAAQLSPEQETALSRLASGNIDGPARKELEALLARNRNAIAFLAQLFKARERRRLKN